jgi:oligopeptide/dipeptide ABC transporter ATP-binding protein
VTALDAVSIDLAPGETVALVGESGSGKSTLARCVVRLTQPSAGTITLDGDETVTLAMSDRDYHRQVQMVFQDPFASLDPRQRVRRILEEPLRRHLKVPRREMTREVRALLQSVGLSEDLLDRRPFELSGGQRQRIGIARALAVRPKVVVLDEPTASLDVSTRGQILGLLEQIQAKTDVAFLLVSHDLSVVRHVADRVLVMYLGAIVESGTAKEVFDHPAHPYTRALIGAATEVTYRAPRSLWRLSGEIPGPIDRPTGCLLAGRCPVARPECSKIQPQLEPVGIDHRAACPFVAEDRRTGRARSTGRTGTTAPSVAVEG